MTKSEQAYIDALKGLAVALGKVSSAVRALQDAPETVFGVDALEGMCAAAETAIGNIEAGLLAIGVDTGRVVKH